MIKAPLVSVIVPNYNHAPYIEQRINSVLNQTYKNFELILLDDCSTDNSRDVIEPYRHHVKVSHVVCNETNSGSTFHQWDRGISLAKSEYIWIAESDDWCEPSLLQTLMDGLLENPSCTVAYCQSFYVRNGNEVFYHTTTSQLSECINGLDYVNQYLIYHSAIYNASMVVFRKSAYQSIPKDYTAFRFCGDWIFWSDMVSRGDVFVSGKLLNYFRSHNTDVSTGMYSSGNSFIEQFRCLLLLKKKFSVSDATYRKALSHYTTLFFSQKKNFTENIVTAVEKLLDKAENKKHRFYLRTSWLMKGVRERLSRSFGLSYE